MAKCQWDITPTSAPLEPCGRAATTMLMKNNGQIVSLCEPHRDMMIAIMKWVHYTRKDPRAATWLVKNEVPS